MKCNRDMKASDTKYSAYMGSNNCMHGYPNMNSHSCSNLSYKPYTNARMTQPEYNQHVGA